jgi:putative transposase
VQLRSQPRWRPPGRFACSRSKIGSAERDLPSIRISRLTSRRVIRTLDEIAAVRGYPSRLRVDNGPENIAGVMLQWSVDHQVDLHFSDPGKPYQNAWIESFNARVRDEFLNLHAFWNLPEMRDAADLWLTDYNEVRPHSSLAYFTPKEFVESLTIEPLPRNGSLKAIK